MFEQGVIRPPSEASSLLVRVTRNCPWNRCHFCPAYKGKKFSKRTIDEIKRDIDEMSSFYSSVSGSFQSAFLQDADSLILPAEDLVEIITHIKKCFPEITRITTYARAKSMKRKTRDAYEKLMEAGLNRIHTGMESGSRKVLKMISKGITPEDILEGGKRVAESKISLSMYVMPGVGGRSLSREHAQESARLLNEVRPDFIRIRTFAMHPKSPLQKRVMDGTIIPMNDEEIISEIRFLLEQLDEMPAYFRCGDFSQNLLMQIDGRLDTHKEAMIVEIDRYLALTKEQKQVYSLIQRMYPGMRSLDIVQDQRIMQEAGKEIEKLERAEEDGFNKHIRKLLTCQLPPLQADQWD